MWANPDVCRLVANNVGSVAHNPGFTPHIVAVNLGKSRPMFAGRATYVCRPLQLHVDIGFRNIDGGLQVAFRSHDDCTRVLAAMEPEWRDRLRQGLGYWVRMQFRSAERAEKRAQAYDPKPTVTQMAESFGLEYDDLADLGAQR